MRCIYDTFTGIDGADLNVHPPDIDLVGGGWTEVAGDWELLGNKTKTTAVANARAIIAAGIYDGRFKVDLTVGLATGTAYLIFRSNTGGTNFWMVGLDDAAPQMVNLYSSAALAFTLVAQKAFAQDEATTYEVKVLCRGDDIEVYVNDALMISHTSALYNTQTVVGLYASGNASARFDDLVVDDRPSCFYCTTGDVKANMGEQWTSGLKYDTLLEGLIKAASRLIDRELGWRDCHYAAADLAASARHYDCNGGLEHWIDRCLDDASFAVAVDENADGTYTAWTKDTDYIVSPYDEGWISRIIIKTGASKVFPVGQRLLRITARWGAFAIPPTEVKDICIKTVIRSFKRGMQAYQDTGALPELGELVYTKALDPDVQEMLRIMARRIAIG